MAFSKDFWSQDRTTIHKRNNWFEKLPLLQRITYILLLLFVIAWCFYLGMAFAMAQAPELPEILDGSDWQSSLDNPEEVNIVQLEGVEVLLLVGADKRPGEKNYRTDTIILAFFNGDTNELKLLSIPRDSYVQLPGKSTKTKINEAYYYGGITLLENTIEYTFGIEVDKYVEMDFSAFVKVIDLLGGVDIDVPVRMYKPTEEINIKKGQQTLSGYDALGFVRFRDLPMGDIDRIANQQAFMRALAAKISTNATIWKAPQMVNIALEYTRTNYTLTEAMTVGSAVLRSDLNNIGTYTLPGDGLYIGAISYWILNKQACLQTISEITGGDVGDAHIIDSGGRATTRPPATQTEEEEAPDEEDMGEHIPDTEGSWSTAPDDQPQETEQPPTEQQPGEEPPAEQPQGENNAENVPEPGSDGTTEVPVIPVPEAQTPTDNSGEQL